MKLRFYIAISTALATLAGCDQKALVAQDDADWRNAPMTHVCTAEQMKKVETETLFCDENTGYFDTYCYGAAIMRNCTEKQHEDDQQ